MIKNIIFDFGDIFINLDKNAPEKQFIEMGIQADLQEVTLVNQAYEVGKITTGEFIKHYLEWLPKNTTKQAISKAWNSMLKDFPIHRLHFLKTLNNSNKYRLFLLSNTNDLHIKWIKENISCYDAFKAEFEKFYLSQEIGLRKPNSDCFNFVLSENELLASETLFIDDTKENTDAANSLGIHTWNLQPEKEDVTDLFTLKKELF